VVIISKSIFRIVENFPILFNLDTECKYAYKELMEKTAPLRLTILFVMN